jgi:uncharacterized protein YecT (DUF1311 family)
MRIHKTYLVVLLALLGGCSQVQPSAAGITTSTKSSEEATPTVAATEDGDEFLRQGFNECVEKSEGVTPEMQACIEVEYQFQDARLHSAYQSLLQMQDATARKSIEQSQKAWLSSNEKECAWNAQDEGQAQRLDANYCNLRSTAKRAFDLEKELAAAK